jgi:hypothetical protein
MTTFKILCLSTRRATIDWMNSHSLMRHSAEEAVRDVVPGQLLPEGHVLYPSMAPDLERFRTHHAEADALALSRALEEVVRYTVGRGFSGRMVITISVQGRRMRLCRIADPLTLPFRTERFTTHDYY